jgi:hypothetical protein
MKTFFLQKKIIFNTLPPQPWWCMNTLKLLSVGRLHIVRQHFKITLATSVDVQTSDLTGIPSRKLTLPQQHERAWRLLLGLLHAAGSCSSCPFLRLLNDDVST